MLAADRVQRFDGGASNYVKVVGLQGEVSALSGPDAYEAVTRNGAEAPNWINQVTLESLEIYIEYLPTASIELISPNAPDDGIGGE